jgi:hypothetical protein
LLEMSRQIRVAPLVAKFLDLAEQLAPIRTSGCPSARKMLMEERRRVRRRRHRIALRKRRQTDPLVNPLAVQPQFPNESPLVAAVARDGSRAAAWADRIRNAVRRNVPVRGRLGDRSNFKASDHNRQIVMFHQAGPSGPRCCSLAAATPIAAVPYSSKGCLTSLRSAPVVRGGLPKSSPSSATLPEGDQENG